VLEEITKGVYWWRSLEVERKRYLNGYIFVGKEGLTLVDPPGLPDAVVPEVSALGEISAVIITGRFQERRAEHFQRCNKVPLYAPEADKRLIRARADNYYKSGDVLPAGLQAISLPHQRTPGECILFHPQKEVIVAGHLAGDPPGYINMQAESLYHNFSSAFQAQLALLEMEHEIILPGLGTPIKEDSRGVLARYLASYPPLKRG